MAGEGGSPTLRVQVDDKVAALPRLLKRLDVAPIDDLDNVPIDNVNELDDAG